MAGIVADGKFEIRKGEGISQAIARELSLTKEQCKNVNWGSIFDIVEDSKGKEGNNVNYGKNGMVHKGQLFEFSAENWKKICDVVEKSLKIKLGNIQGEKPAEATDKADNVSTEGKTAAATAELTATKGSPQETMEQRLNKLKEKYLGLSDDGILEIAARDVEKGIKWCEGKYDEAKQYVKDTAHNIDVKLDKAADSANNHIQVELDKIQAKIDARAEKLKFEEEQEVDTSKMTTKEKIEHFEKLIIDLEKRTAFGIISKDLKEGWNDLVDLYNGADTAINNFFKKAAQSVTNKVKSWINW